ncbi:MAG TPA: DNA polymerase III subunit delta' [Candidatus Binatia bacterium]|nr:DNA polymerase III subunit delta' [Candidatus Binatia bacterium]
MGFSQIVGQQKQLEIVRQALIHRRLHHAYLFVGMEGVGKKTMALALAKAIHCSSATGDFCGECADCARIQDGNHPDVRILEPLAGKKEISIRQIRELEKELNFRSFSGKKKIAIVDPATLMNLSAQNALLKTLEEPPEESLLILIAANGGALLPTLRSRCLRMSFGPLARELISGFLVSHKGIDGKSAECLAAMSLGSLGAVAGMNMQDLLERRREWVQLVCCLRAGDYRAASDAAEILAGSKEDSLRFLEWVEGWFRDLLAYSVTRNPRDVVNADMLPEIQQQVASAGFEHLFSRIAEAKAALEGIQRNLNRRLLLEDLLLNTVEAS